MNRRNLLDTVPILDRKGVQLLLAFFFDGVGMLSYFIPGLGELFDIIYGPVQGAIIYTMIGAERGRMFFIVLGIGEEMLPFTDFIPSCTLAWLWKYRRQF